MPKSLNSVDISVVRSGVVQPLNRDAFSDGVDDTSPGQDGHGNDPWWDNDDDGS